VKERGREREQVRERYNKRKDIIQTVDSKRGKSTFWDF